MECSFVGVPTPTVLWYKGTGDDSVAIPQSNENYTVTLQTNKYVLTIHDVTDGDNDMYTCVATNTINGMSVMDNKAIGTKICSKQISICT